LPKDVQQRFNYVEQTPNPQTLRKPDATPDAAEPMAISGIETLPPITVKLRDELLNALKMTDKLDALHKRGCTSAEFIAAAVPIEGVINKLQYTLPKADPRRDLLVNTFLLYQNAAVVMKANDTGGSERPDVTVDTARFRKHLLTKILEGDMTPEEKNFYYGWRKALETNP